MQFLSLAVLSSLWLDVSHCLLLVAPFRCGWEVNGLCRRRCSFVSFCLNQKSLLATRSAFHLAHLIILSACHCRLKLSVEVSRHKIVGSPGVLVAAEYTMHSTHLLHSSVSQIDSKAANGLCCASSPELFRPPDGITGLSRAARSGRWESTRRRSGVQDTCN